jgi:hypothetical protein
MRRKVNSRLRGKKWIREYFIIEKRSRGERRRGGEDRI